jgi:hypothetical protein
MTTYYATGDGIIEDELSDIGANVNNTQLVSSSSISGTTIYDKLNGE